MSREIPADDELCRHELALGTCSYCTAAGQLRRQPPEPVSQSHSFDVGDLICWTADGYVCEGHAEVVP